MIRLASLPLLLVAAGCGSSPRPDEGPTPEGASPEPYVGCYEAVYLKPDRERIHDRWEFRLFAEVANSRKPGGGTALPQRRATASVQGQDDPWWRVTATGFQMYMGDTLHGAYYDFRPAAAGFVGREFTAADTFEGFRSESMRARKVACPG